MAIPDELFQDLYTQFKRQQELLESIAEKIQGLEGLGGSGSGSGGGSATIEDYESGKAYERNTLLVDTDTEIVYRVIDPYGPSVTVKKDCEEGHLKLVGFESQVVTFDHNPTQKEINVLPDDTLVAMYSRTDPPYSPMQTE